SWEAVAAIVARVVADHVDDSRLDELYRIGVDGRVRWVVYEIRFDGVRI
ncbi:hypothetical protein SAMN06265360_1537, partial [Haloechinothrix alba]